MLRKLPGHALEPDQRGHHPTPQRLRQGIQGRLPARVAGEARAVEQLHRPQRRIVGQGRQKDLAIRLGLGRAPDLASIPLRVVIHRRDRVLVHDPPDRPDGRAAEGRHVGQRVARPPEHLNLVSLEHVDHPFPRWRWGLQRFSAQGALRKGDQNFRKRRDQNFRNPHKRPRTAHATFRAARSGSPCSQNRKTLQPACFSRVSVSRSRATFATIFSRHHEAFALGQVAWTGQACQKQPSTKTATFAQTKARSARRRMPGIGQSTR